MGTGKRKGGEYSHIRHNDDDHMLLEVERARLQVELPAENTKYAIGKYQIPTAADWICDELDYECREAYAGIPEGEEHVDSGADSAQDHTDDPGADGICREIDVEISYGCSDLDECWVSLKDQKKKEKKFPRKEKAT